MSRTDDIVAVLRAEPRLTQTEVARRFGCSRQYVSQVAERFGLSPDPAMRNRHLRRHHATDDEVVEIRRLVDCGLGVAFAARAVGKSAVWGASIARQHGIVARDHSVHGALSSTILIDRDRCAFCIALRTDALPVVVTLLKSRLRRRYGHDIPRSGIAHDWRCGPDCRRPEALTWWRRLTGATHGLRRRMAMSEYRAQWAEVRRALALEETICPAPSSKTS